MVFSISSDFDGIMSCLWDTSNKEFGEMNFYDRENDTWYDEKLKENFLEISRGKYVKPTDFYIKTHFETVTISVLGGTLEIKVGARKALKIIINLRLTGTLFVDTSFNIFSYDTVGRFINIILKKKMEKSNMMELLFLL